MTEGWSPPVTQARGSGPASEPRWLASAWTLAVLLALGAWGCNKSERQLTGAEMEALFAGKTVVGRHELRGYTFRSYYEPGGTFRSYQGGRTTPRHGQWAVEADQVCIAWQDTSERFCRRMFVDPGGTYRKVMTVARGERVVVVTFERFTVGNPHGL